MSIATDYPESFTVASTTIPQDDVEREPDGFRSKRKSILHRGRFGAGGSDAAMPLAACSWALATTSMMVLTASLSSGDSMANHRAHASKYS
jgi:hypothetical protein